VDPDEIGTVGGSMLIDEESLAQAREMLGVSRPLRPWDSEVTADSIWHFALGIGDDNPLWNDPEYAAHTAWRGLIAPPTYLYTGTSGGSPVGSTNASVAETVLPGVLALWTSDRWQWYDQTRPGTHLTATEELHSLQELPDTGRGRRVEQVERQKFYGDGKLLAICDKTSRRIARAETSTPRPIPEYEIPQYAPSDRERIARQYEEEYRQRRGATPRPGGTVVLGDHLGHLVKGPLTVTNIVAWLLGWGSSICRPHRMQYSYLREHPGARLFDASMGVDDVIEAPHFSPYLARESGMATAYDFGAQRISWIAHLLTDWCGDSGYLSDLFVRLVRPNYVGDTTWIEGNVTNTNHTAHGWVIECAVSATNQRGELTAEGTAAIVLPT
jgi:acyl dehydratase